MDKNTRGILGEYSFVNDTVSSRKEREKKSIITYIEGLFIRRIHVGLPGYPSLNSRVPRVSRSKLMCH